MSAILLNATNLRKLMNNATIYPFQFKCSWQNRYHPFGRWLWHSGALEDGYKDVGRTETTIIVRSNKRANLYNRQIRMQIMSLENDLAVGDLWWW